MSASLAKFRKFDCCRHSPRAAFSLVEMLAVISILMVLASLAGPALNSVMTGGVLSGGVDRAWSAISDARQLAITHNAPVALLFTTDRHLTSSDKSDAFILAAAKPAVAANGSAMWKWGSEGTWRKLPRGLGMNVGRNSGNDAAGFYSSASLPSAYALVADSLPLLESESVGNYYLIVFRPDGSVDAPTSSPYLEFMRLNAGVTHAEKALSISPDSGRVRLVEYTAVP